MMDPRRDEYLRIGENELLRQCMVDTLRGSGPGGQKRNKTESAVRLRHLPSGLIVLNDETRSQHHNRQRALRILRERIALRLRCPVQLASYEPPRALQQLVAGKLGRQSDEYLQGAAALLDLFLALQCSVRDTAARLGLSTGGLSRLLLADQRLTAAANALREEHSLRPLR